MLANCKDKNFEIICFLPRLPLALNRSSWKGSDEIVLPVHRLRLEGMILYSVYLRDTLDGMAARKIKDLSKNFKIIYQTLIFLILGKPRK